MGRTEYWLFEDFLSLHPSNTNLFIANSAPIIINLSFADRVGCRKISKILYILQIFFVSLKRCIYIYTLSYEIR